MRSRYWIGVVGIVLLVLGVLFLNGCVGESARYQYGGYKAYEVLTSSTSSKLSSDAISKIDYVDYDRSLCGSISNHHKSGGFNTGLRILLKDKTTGAKLDGYATISMEEGGRSLSLDSYSCEEQITSDSAVVSVYSEGYAPVVLRLDLPKNQLVTVEVLMTKSCSGDSSCIRNLDEKSRKRFFDMIKENFGLEKSEYVLLCSECDMQRGGYIKAEGTHKDGSSFELYYHWGWCSSGGSDCGWEICFSSTSEKVFESVKKHVCNRISAKYYKDLCLSGKYEKVAGNKQVLAIKQILDGDRYSIKKGSFDCLGR